ncbi:MAG: hypothetical protein KJZ86_17385 [Caldilineaceae bacterium]|nr:hypothetical protein [Caldilineaceae bacterium]
MSTPATIRLTTTQAVVRFLQNQYSERDSHEQRFFAGCFGIIGHGNVSGIDQTIALHLPRPLLQQLLNSGLLHGEFVDVGLQPA